jgi:hypothetical protein
MIFFREASNKITAHIPMGSEEQTFDCSTVVCQNPVCQCNEIFVNLAPTGSANEDTEPSSQLTIGIDIAKETLIERGHSDEDLELCRRAHALFNREDYQLLWEEYYKEKRYITEHADINAIEAQFPADEIERDGTMVGYIDVLPYASHFTVELGSQTYLVADMHCVRKDCKCTVSILRYFPLDVSGSLADPTLTVSVDHRTKTWEDMEEYSAANSAFTQSIAKQSLEGKYPNVYQALGQRQQQLKILYSNFLKAHPTLQVVGDKKVGRNDPCPCGSGKKFKKCCGK